MADLINAGWYLSERKYVDAGLSAVSAVPVVGDAIGIARLSAKGVHAVEEVREAKAAVQVVKTELKATAKTVTAVEEVSKVTTAVKSGETSATALGREMHTQYNPGPTFQKEFILDSGRRADAVDVENRIVRELKPDNPRAITRGVKQVEEYRKELEQMFQNGKWTAIVDTYGR